MTGRIFDIKRFAIHDGPGIRTTVFLKGCPLCCVWCHNPEGIDSGMGLWIKSEQCIRCGGCVTRCPAQALSSGTETTGVPGVPRINRDVCSVCGTCVDHCPSRAIRRIDAEVSPQELAHELLLDRVFFDVSGGGVTLSGGEPLAQPDFALTLLGLLKQEGVHTCMETSLFAPAPVIQGLADVLDFLMCDIKLIKNEAHQKYTGGSNKIILDNFRRFAPIFPRVLVRVPLVPGITADEENLRAVGEFVRFCASDIEIELLNYNWFSQSKYAWLDKPHFNAKARAFTNEEITRFYCWVRGDHVD